MKKHNTIGKGEAERAVNGGDDKYYTKQYVADYFSNIVLEAFGKDADYVEPTAGDGAFMSVLPNITGYDLKPERSDIITMDVFDNEYLASQVIVGNPPFGMAASLAIRIFNHLASKNVKAICFILPRSFKKDSVKNKLDSHYHLTYQEDVKDDAFTVNGNNINVPCVFQIWTHKATARKPYVEPTTDLLEFTTADKADVAVRRAGGKAGQVLEGLDHNPVSTYFIKTDHLDALRVMNLDVVDWTAGVRSISKPELINEFNKIMEKLDA